MRCSMSSLQIKMSIFVPKIVTFSLLVAHSSEKFCYSVLCL